jgi:hypothetical protein
MAVSFARARQLRGRYRVLYNCLSWLMVLLGCGLVGVLLFKSRVAFGLPTTRASLEGLRLQFLGWGAFTLVSIPLLFYLAMFAVGGVFGVLMIMAGSFSCAEAKALALYGQPPQRWVEAGRSKL